MIYNVVIAYDLAKPPGNHGVFKAALVARGYNVRIIDKQGQSAEMPNTTVYKLTEAPSPSMAAVMARADLLAAKAFTIETAGGCVIERFYSFVAPDTAGCVYDIGGNL